MSSLKKLQDEELDITEKEAVTTSKCTNEKGNYHG